jgi:HK97 family phage prohead protease
MMDKMERRSVEAGWEVREADGKVGLRGYAALFDTPAHGEVIRSSAFTKTLAEQDDVRLLVNHDGVPIARTKSGTLTLTVDERGLFMDAPDLDMSNPTVQELVSAMARSDIDQCSFSFIPVRDQIDPETRNRELLEVRLMDVSVVTYPWYEQTSVGLRDLDLALAEVRSGAVSPEARETILRVLDDMAPEMDDTAEDMPDTDEGDDMVAARSLPDYLNTTLADVFSLYYRAHAAHWNVVGPDFAQYHDLFGHIYEDTYESIDPLAENIRKVGGVPVSTLPQILGARTIDDSPVSMDARTLAADLMTANDLVIDCLRRSREAADEADQSGLANFLDERIDAHQGWRWQLASSLGIATVPMRSQTPEATESRVARNLEVARLYLA